MNDDYLKYLPRTEWSHPESVAGYIWKLRKRHMDYDEFFQIICKYVATNVSIYSVFGLTLFHEQRRATFCNVISPL